MQIADVGHRLVNSAVVFLRSVEALMRGGAIEPGDVLVIRERRGAVALARQLARMKNGRHPAGRFGSGANCRLATTVQMG
jgi:hypothetical protein